MKKNISKFTALALTVCMSAALICGCGGNAAPNNATSEMTKTSEVQTSEPAQTSESQTASETQTSEPAKAELSYDIVEAAVADASVYSGTPDTSWYVEGQKEFTLTTADQLMGFQELRAQENAVNFEGVTIKLGANMTINEGTIADLRANGGTIWKNLNSDNEFKGTFDGQGHTISGIYMKLSKAANKGMFGTLGGEAAVMNFTLNSSYFSGPTAADKVNFAAISGTVTGTNVKISDVHVNALIEANEGTALGNVGGFVGSISTGTTLTIENCSFGGAITTDGECVGGYIGLLTHSKADVTIKNCTSTGAVKGKDCVGDFIGWAKKSKNLVMEECTSAGEQIGLKGND